MKQIAHFFSIAGHPFFILTYTLAFLLLVNPYAFGSAYFSERLPLLAVIFMYTFFMPLIAILLMRAAGFVQSYSLESTKERIAPYAVTGTLYLWTFQTLLHNNQLPHIFKVALLGTIIGLFLAFFVNIFSKISVHATGMGSLTGIVYLSMLTYFANTVYVVLPNRDVLEITMPVILMISLLFAGIVGSSRLILNKHEPVDIYRGFLIGFTAQYGAFYFLNLA